jgi:DNA adenine methylase
MATVKLDIHNLSLTKTTPFIKWVGGKRSLIDILKSNLPNNYNTYFEPFVGGGALFFAIQPKNAILSDINEDLVITYNMVKKQPIQLLELLHKHHKLHNEEYYYQIRQQHESDDPLNKASRFIYLNKTCYNGLYRVNSKGEFNVPIGSYKNPNIADDENIKSCSIALKTAKIEYNSFERSLLLPKKDDFVYLDPPYAPIDSNSFTKYSKDDFMKSNQIALYNSCKQLHERGVKFMLSNSDTQLIRNLYKDSIFNIQTVVAPRMVNCKANGRNGVNEVLIRNY